MVVGEERMVFPGPLLTFKETLMLLKKGYTYRCILESMKRMGGGFLTALFSGLFLGTISGNFPSFKRFLSPLVTALRAIPTASLVYLFIVLSGFRKAPMIMVSVISFPIIYESVSSGLSSIEQDIRDAASLDGGGFLRNNVSLFLPLAFPFIESGLFSSFSLSFKIEIMAEVICGASLPGLGSIIAGVRSGDPTNMVPVFAYSLIAVVLMLMVDFFAYLARGDRA